VNKLTLGLIKGRHDIKPVTDYIFEESVIEPFDYAYMRKTIHQKLGDCNCLHLYVTGLTQALIEVVNYCIFSNIKLTLYHFNRDTNKYETQDVLTDVHKHLLIEGGYLREWEVF